MDFGVWMTKLLKANDLLSCDRQMSCNIIKTISLSRLVMYMEEILFAYHVSHMKKVVMDKKKYGTMRSVIYFISNDIYDQVIFQDQAQ